MTDRNRKLIRNTTILGIGTILSKSLSFIMIPFFSRWLTPEEYGTFDLYTTYIMLLVPFITLSCGESVFRFLIDAESIYEKKSIISSGLLIITLGSIIYIAFIAIYALNYGKILLMPFLFYLASDVINHYLLAYLRGIKRLEVYAISNIVYMVTMTLTVTINVYFLQLGLSGMLYGYAIGYLISNTYIIVATKFAQYCSFNAINKSQIKSLIKFSIPLIPNSISWWIVNASDRTIIKIVLGEFFNGVYAIANKLPAICTVLFSVFHISWKESASEHINDHDRNIYFNDVLNKIIIILISICVCVLSVNFIVFNYIIEKSYYNAYYHVPILITGVILTVLSQFVGGIYIGLKKPLLNGLTTVVAAAVNIVINLLLIKYIGLFASSISTLLSYVFLCTIRFVSLRDIMIFKLERKTYIYIAIYAYFVVVNYINNTYINIFNIMLASIIFLLTNWNMIFRLVRKVFIRFKFADN